MNYIASGTSPETAADKLLEAAVYLVRRSQPTLIGPVQRSSPSLRKKTHDKDATDGAAGPGTVSELVRIARRADWPTRCRLAAFLSEVPPAVLAEMSPADLANLRSAPSHLGAKDKLLDDIVAFNSFSPTYATETVESFRDHRALRDDLRARMDTLSDLLQPDTALTMSPMLMRSPYDAVRSIDHADAGDGGSVPAGVTPLSAKLLEDSITATATDGDLSAAGNLTLLRSFDTLAWLLDPLKWKSCITQVQDVIDEGAIGPPPGKRVKEIINLAAPARIGVGTMACELGTSTADDFVPGGTFQRRTMTYSLMPGGSDTLQKNEGSLCLYETVAPPATPTDPDPSMCVFTFSKRIQFLNAGLWHATFSLNPDGLRDMLKYWLLDATFNCS